MKRSFCFQQRRWISHFPRLRVTKMFPPPSSKKIVKGESKSKSSELMEKYGLIQGSVSGTYHLMPMTVRALKKLEFLIDSHMQGLGAHKISATFLGSKEQWTKSGRWNEMGSELFTLKDRTNKHICLSPTHEEAITSIVRCAQPVTSYKQLPLRIYQIGRKFRDEMRPKNGLLRCREFEMKDLYTFDESEGTGKETYYEVCAAYESILKTLKLPFAQVTGNPGLMGGKLSHEFQILSEVGEDRVLVCPTCNTAANKECSELGHLECSKEDCPKTSNLVSGIEVAHAFLLGLKYSSMFGANFTKLHYQSSPLFMGCYGIGTTRLVAAALESLSLDDEIRWPRLIAPHQICLIPQMRGYKSEVTDAIAEQLHEKLCALPHLSMEVVMDDRTKMSIGYRVKLAKRMGYPFIVTVGKESLEEQPRFELIDVCNKHTEYFSESMLLEKLSLLEVLPA